jgi:hypothetical protein
VTKRLAAALFLVLLGGSNAAFAAPASDTKECIASFDQGQHSKTDHHLKLAQTQLLACTKETCPAVLRADCAEVLKSVQSALPSIVFAAEDGGKDVTDVKVFNGSDQIASSLDAKAVELDPGTYDFRFERGTNTPLTVHFVLREGEKNREVRGIFNPPKPITTTTIVVAPEREVRSTVGYVVPAAFAVLGVAGFIFAGVGKLTFNSDVNDFRAPPPAGCAPNCTEASRADLSSTLVRANVALGVGIGGLVLAAASWFIFTPGYKKPQQPPTSALLTW